MVPSGSVPPDGGVGKSIASGTCDGHRLRIGARRRPARARRSAARLRLGCGTVSAMPRGRPGGTVTFLFTDIEDSTRRWDEDPSDMADALRVHDAILRGAIERHGGYVFGTGGDGFCAAFSTAADAAAAAVESQEELRDDSTVDFAVRMGLHTGEAIERDRNYFGSEVNRAARLMSIAHGGQVLVSDATEVLLRDRVGAAPAR